MRNLKKLTDDEVKDLLSANPQAAQIFESLRAYVPAEKYSALFHSNDNSYEKKNYV